MIGYVKGTLISTWQNTCLILTAGGVGYEINLTLPALSNLPDSGMPVELYICMIVREDAQELYGFSSLEEKRTFETLVGISKIGARTALAILSIYNPEDLIAIVREGNTSALTKVAGIGQKTAQHVLLELQYKFASKKLAANRTANVEQPPNAMDVLAAMINLGYSEEECAPVIKRIFKDEPDLDVGSAIRQALKLLAKGNN